MPPKKPAGTPRYSENQRKDLAKRINNRVHEIRAVNGGDPFTIVRVEAYPRKNTIRIVGRRESFSISTEEAETYLAWLDAGHVGTPYDARTTPTPETREYRVEGPVELVCETQVTASSPQAARVIAYRAPQSAWRMTDKSWHSFEVDGRPFPTEVWDVSEVAPSDADRIVRAVDESTALAAVYQRRIEQAVTNAGGMLDLLEGFLKKLPAVINDVRARIEPQQMPLDVPPRSHIVAIDRIHDALHSEIYRLPAASALDLLSALEQSLPGMINGFRDGVIADAKRTEELSRE